MNPIKDFLQKEIAIYNHNRKVPLILEEPMAKIANPRQLAFGSTDLLIENFFQKLQESNVNTIPTVVRLT